MSDLILVERDGGIVTVVLNRPHKLNALTKPMWGELGATLVERVAQQFDHLRPCLLGAFLRHRRGNGFGEGAAVDHRALVGDAAYAHCRSDIEISGGLAMR